MKNSRRQFLRNVSLTALSAGMLPTLLKANNRLDSQDTIACNPTTLDAYGQGPYYKANAPAIINNQLASQSEPGTRLIISGSVQTLNCSAVIPNTIIDVWHANDAAQYDSAGFNLRGIAYSNIAGFYLFETILPGKYLNGSQYRPRHLHFIITPPGFPTMITQLYFEGDTSIPADFAASQTSGTYDATHRIIPIILNAQGQYEGTWDIVVDGSGVGVADIHSDKGIIYSASPNPFTDSLEINYGIFQSAKVSISIVDLKGSLVAILDEKNLDPQKYKATWNPNTDISKGVYWVTLKMNDLQVHYLKIIKT